MDQQQRSSAIVLFAGLGKSENTDGSRRCMAIAPYRFSDQINIAILRRDVEQDATRRCKHVARNRKVSKRPYCDSAEWRKRRKGAVKRIHALFRKYVEVESLFERLVATRETNKQTNDHENHGEIASKILLRSSVRWTARRKKEKIRTHLERL